MRIQNGKLKERRYDTAFTPEAEEAMSWITSALSMTFGYPLQKDSKRGGLTTNEQNFGTLDDFLERGVTTKT
jgi:hypothetical protein